MTRGTTEDHAQGDTEISTANSPVWILGLTFALGLLGFATTLFFGMSRGRLRAINLLVLVRPTSEKLRS
jgi:hypothetical protein